MPQDDQSSSETLLIQEAIAGNKEAFGRLYEKYAGQIFSYLFYRTGEHNTAMDMMEIVFLRAWEHLPHFGTKGRGLNFRAWLYRMAHNAMVDYHRTNKEEIGLDLLAEQPDHYPQAAKLVEQSETQQYLIKKLEKLDGLSRQVLVLRFYAEMSPKEVAQIMDISEGNVRVIQFRALQKMRSLIGEDDE
jgi:RNA polymerase sigma-70 factor (ECF subfamily)